MKTFGIDREMVQDIKKRYPTGTRIMLLYMGDDPRPIAPNTRGTVRMVDDIGTVHCGFDNGRYLGVIPGEDSLQHISRILQDRLEDEQKGKPHAIDRKLKRKIDEKKQAHGLKQG